MTDKVLGAAARRVLLDTDSPQPFSRTLFADARMLAQFVLAPTPPLTATAAPDDYARVVDKVRVTVAATPGEPDALPVTLAECPIGLFWADSGELCLKSEYGNNEGRIDAYIVSSGEMFWGAPPQTIASQRAQLVTPIDYDEAIAKLRTRGSKT